MRSSGSTPRRRSRSTVRLLVLLTGEDHPKACTGRRLIHWHRARQVDRESEGLPGPVVLDPYAPTPLSGEDAVAAEQGGILVIDCSWNRLSSRGAFPGEDGGGRRRGRHRRLPVLVATNPQHYGRLAQLNTAEAFCAALYVIGRPAEAAGVIEGFAGGPQFISVNRDRLDRYREASGPQDVVAAEKALFGET